MLSSLFRRFLPLPDTFAAELLVVVTLTFKNRRNLALLVTICMVHSTTLWLLGNFRWKRSYYFDKICRKSFRTSWEISSVKLSPWSNHENSSTIPFLNTAGISKKKFDDFKKKKDNLINRYNLEVGGRLADLYSLLEPTQPSLYQNRPADPTPTRQVVHALKYILT